MNRAPASGYRHVVAIDGGLRTGGMVALRVHPTLPSGRNAPWSQCVSADAIELKPDHAMQVNEDRVRRTRLWSRWFRGHLDRWDPALLAVEALSFPRGADAIICVSLAWGVIASEVERRSLPLVTVGPKQWRLTLAPNGSEQDAHMAAIRAIPTFLKHGQAIVSRLQLHALDALGVAEWALVSGAVRKVMP